MNRKIYYNLTRIENGWLLNYPKYSSGTSSLAMGTIESYYETLGNTLEFVKSHFLDTELDKSDEKCVSTHEK